MNNRPLAYKGWKIRAERAGAKSGFRGVARRGNISDDTHECLETARFFGIGAKAEALDAIRRILDRRRDT